MSLFLTALFMLLSPVRTSAAPAASTEWLLQTSHPITSLQNLMNCQSEILNPHTGADIFKIKCERNNTLTELSPLASLHFEKESSWNLFNLFSGELNDPMANDQWALDQMNVRSFWQEHAVEKASIKVAVIDTGVDFTHEDLVQQIVINANEIPDNQIDDDQNGYIDDVYGWNAQSSNGDVMDLSHHGTHVAGIISAKPDNNIGIAGMNWGPVLIPIRFIDSSGGGSTESAIRAFDYAVARKAKIINTSWGGRSNSPLLKEMISRCRDLDILVVAAAGNESMNNDILPIYPASFDLDNIISVAAVDLHGRLPGFSNWGVNTVHIAAPGQSILSTMANKKYGYNSGTSMAAPYIAGAAALIWAQNPSWTYKDVRHFILQNCKQTPELQNKIQCGGYFSF